MTPALQSSPAFQRLAGRYADPLGQARAAKAAGRHVIGRVGATVPVEFILAAGCTPVMLAADLRRATPQADRYVDPELPAETRALCEAALSGDYECLDLLILSRPYDKLYYFLKELHRSGRAPQMPPFMIHDLMHSQREAVREYNRGRLRALLERVSRHAVRPVDNAALREAIVQTNHVRALWRRLQALRHMGRLAGVEALQIIGAGLCSHPAEHEADLHACLEAIEAGAAAHEGRRPRVIAVSAEPMQHLALHSALEHSGGLVVAEDDPWGARAAGMDIADSPDPFDALFDKLWHDTPSTGVWPPAARHAWLLTQAARPDVDAVVLHIPPSDRLLGWDLPDLLRALRDRGTPATALFHDVQAAAGQAALVREASAFFEAVNSGAVQEMKP